MTLRIALAGAGGKMGRLIAALIADAEGAELVASLGSADAPEGMLGADVLVDVTTPEASGPLVRFAIEKGLGVLVGTSGWSQSRLDELAGWLEGRDTGVIVVPNFSLGSVLATRLAAEAGRFFDSIEIIEAHPASKIDSPSGTATRTAERIAAAREAAGAQAVAAPSAGQAARGQLVAGIPVHSLRMEGIEARQEVLLGGVGEQLAIRHDTLSKSSYHQGILLALRAVPSTRGLVVGLDSLLGLDS